MYIYLTFVRNCAILVLSSEKIYMKIDITKIRWAIKVISKSNLYRAGGVSEAKAIDIAVAVLRQVRDGELISKGKKS